MNQFQKLQISFSPQRKQNQNFPAINLKTAESPQKGSIEQSNYNFSQHLHYKFNNRKVKMNLKSQLNKAYTIRKYLQVNSSVQNDLNIETQILQNISTTQNTESSIQNKQSLSPFKQLNNIERSCNVKRNLLGLSDINYGQPEFNIRQQSYSPFHNQCIIEQDKEQKEGDKNQNLGVQEQLIMSPIQFNNLKEISEYKQSKSQSPNRHNIALKINQQNTDYKKYASQMIRMIRSNQQNLMKKFDQEQKEQERDYKAKKIQRQLERKEGLQIAQEDIKNRQLKFMLIALKGQQDKFISDSQSFQNKGKKLNLQSSQTAIHSRKSSLQNNYQQLPLDRIFDDRNLKKYSLKSEICSIETSLEQPLQISKLI
ncbi:unnamed protein product [Paramecium sonneborni]|uniref:Uncharacterized protein n=1 Tax=Paramecium sonneborni TaxID=65129 RepID=A0A8S1KY77_9CILI|nr:unnamed protein product [Paramecium sonneborni]